MTRTTSIRIPLFALVFGLAFAASAQTPTPAATQDEVAANTAAAAVPADADKPIDGNKDVTDSNCLKQTGSRIAPRPDKQGRKCVNAPGRAYSKEDLDRTGATGLADALRRLDPSVR